MRQQSLRDNPVLVAYGGGTNSTAMLIELVRLGERVDLITFSDTGGEQPRTYEYVTLFSKWLVERGYPEVTTVHRVNKDGDKLSLESNCIDNKMLPSLAYGFKKCSLKFKVQPQDKFVNSWEPAKEVWARGEKVTKLLGYDADEPHRAQIQADKKYDYTFPLIEWGWAREECVGAIKDAGLPLPGKSSCFFCPAMRPNEILALPCDLKKRALAIEDNADLKSIKGLGRGFSWREVIEADERQIPLPGIVPDILCGCYDGE